MLDIYECKIFQLVQVGYSLEVNLITSLWIVAKNYITSLPVPRNMHK